jgi:hypothetical protein
MRWPMTRTARRVAAILIALVLSLALAGCPGSDDGGGGGGGYLPAPGSSAPGAS